LGRTVKYTSSKRDINCDLSVLEIDVNIRQQFHSFFPNLFSLSPKLNAIDFVFGFQTKGSRGYRVVTYPGGLSFKSLCLYIPSLDYLSWLYSIPGQNLTQDHNHCLSTCFPFRHSASSSEFLQFELLRASLNKLQCKQSSGKSEFPKHKLSNSCSTSVW
jgi:hypothetical protein